MRSYEYRHIVGFEETNLLGNVYYAHFISWQGQCREMFLREHAPEVLAEIHEGLVLATTRCSCEYFSELVAFDEVLIRMRLGVLAQNRLTMTFQYVRKKEGMEEIVARGEQQVAFMRLEGKQLMPGLIPTSLKEALRPYMAA